MKNPILRMAICAATVAALALPASARPGHGLRPEHGPAPVHGPAHPGPRHAPPPPPPPRHHHHHHHHHGDNNASLTAGLIGAGLGIVMGAVLASPGK